ncbi:phosphodiesterase, partial [Streptomyces fradiae]
MRAPASAPGVLVERGPAAGGAPCGPPGDEVGGARGQLVLALLCGGYATGALLGWGSERLALVMGDFGLSAAALVAAVSCFRYGRAHGSPFRPAWLLFALSSAMAACGNAVWGWYEVVLGRPVPDPSLADVFFLLFAPPAIVGLLVLAKRPVNRAEWVCLALDSWLIAGSLLTLSWSLALAHTARVDGESVVRAALSLAYPLLDIVLVSMVLALHFRRSRGNRTAVHTAVAALALTVLCDALFTSPLLRDTYSSGQLLDAGWFAGSLLLAYAPWAARRARERSTSASRSWAMTEISSAPRR